MALLTGGTAVEMPSAPFTLLSLRVWTAISIAATLPTVVPAPAADRVDHSVAAGNESKVSVPLPLGAPERAASARVAINARAMARRSRFMDWRSWEHASEP